MNPKREIIKLCFGGLATGTCLATVAWCAVILTANGNYAAQFLLASYALQIMPYTINALRLRRNNNRSAEPTPQFNLYVILYSLLKAFGFIAILLSLRLMIPADAMILSQTFPMFAALFACCLLQVVCELSGFLGALFFVPIILLVVRPPLLTNSTLIAHKMATVPAVLTCISGTVLMALAHTIALRELRAIPLTILALFECVFGVLITLGCILIFQLWTIPTSILVIIVGVNGIVIHAAYLYLNTYQTIICTRPSIPMLTTSISSAVVYQIIHCAVTNSVPDILSAINTFLLGLSMSLIVYHRVKWEAKHGLVSDNTGGVTIVPENPFYGNTVDTGVQYSMEVVKLTEPLNRRHH